MSVYGTEIGVHYSKNLLQPFFRETFYPMITNQDFYEEANGKVGEKAIKKMNQEFLIAQIKYSGLKTYNGSDLTAGSPTESTSRLRIDQSKAVHELVKDIDVFASFVKDPNSSLIEQAKEDLKVQVEDTILGLWGDVAAGQRIGTDHTSGTVEIDANGVVTGTTTSFTAAMVGKPFNAAGHSKWYRVKTYSSGTSITIEQDLDDEDATYDGGVISAGASYTIQAATALAVTQNTIAQYLIQLSETLDDASVPMEGRYVVLPTKAKSAVLKAPEFNADIEKVHDDTVKKGKLARAYGFDIYFSKTVSGDNSSGYHVIAGHKSFITMGFGYISPIVVKKPENNFGDLISGLFGWGAKVADARRMAGAELFATFSLA